MPELEQTGSQSDKRFSAIIWGDAGTFKTTLTATARGNKLYILFDDGGLDSVEGLREKLETSHPTLDTALKNKIYKLDYTKEDKVNYISKFETADDPLDITKYLTDAELNIKTVVVDSLTPLGDDVLTYAVKYKGYNKSTITNPGQQAYGARLTLLKMFVINMLKLTAKHNKDIIFISHAKDKTDDQGALVAISLALGGNLANEVGIKLGEIWFCSNSATKGREITVVPFRQYKPMKTRMFELGEGKPTSFAYKYDIANPDPKYEIASMIDAWAKSGYNKIAFPK